MKSSITFIILIISFALNAQNKKEIISLMEEYANSYSQPNYNHEFVNTTLNPALKKLEKLICKYNDYTLLNNFIKMLLKTKGSANEIPPTILGGIFICKPEAIEKYLKQIYTDKYLKDLLILGFNNNTNDKKEEIINYSRLKKRLNTITQTK